MEHLDQWAAFRHALTGAIAECTVPATIADPQWCLHTPALEPREVIAGGNPLSLAHGLVSARAWHLTRRHAPVLGTRSTTGRTLLCIGGPHAALHPARTAGAVGGHCQDQSTAGAAGAPRS